MMAIRKIVCLTIALALLFIVQSDVFSQSKKDIKKYNIKSTTVTVVDLAGGKEVSHIETVEKYDKDGNVTEDLEYNKNGTFRKNEIRTYNKAGEITYEAKYDEKGVLLYKLVTTYNVNNDKLTEQKTDGSGKIILWIKYGYDSMGDKIFELELDEKGKTLKKSMFTYDKNGLRKEKKIYNGKEELIAIKKYTYVLQGEE
ncbi:MAG: hypothetical protein M3Q95_01510 [Bacteroidota bacterium]|nr:hypothetical protein [Bacteroidota bacterium]